ncbi:probable multidrug resistance-associated protein lethal(2)03659 [Coccinella septempunctata]|uniref:probable multidrug resistance-associated protein lethal(2)03659 n=1 Tax=Coccinella septempunctata TaxID=41139 RepID=UPI001D08F05B|nr:probable multidrug resistance-associated protein lethal(2)03659 [Coccinella septempunctata]
MLETIQAEIEEKESRNITKTDEKNSEDMPQMEKEEVVQGEVDLHTYWSYLRAGGNLFLISILIFLILMSHVASFGGDYFVAYWVNLEQVKVVQPRIAYPASIQRTFLCQMSSNGTPLWVFPRGVLSSPRYWQITSCNSDSLTENLTYRGSISVFK